MLHGPTQLPHEIEEVVEAYVLETDEDFARKLERVGMSEAESQQYAPLSTMGQFCLGSIDLANNLVEAGYKASCRYNNLAARMVVKVAEVCTYTVERTHLLVAVEHGGQTVFIDPYWQQFMYSAYGPIDDETIRAGAFNMRPQERVISYTAENLPFVTRGFASIVRMMQNGILRHPGSSSVAFTRELSILDFIGGAEYDGPVAYEPITTLEARANQVWNPLHYRPLESGEAEMLLMGVDLAERASG